MQLGEQVGAAQAAHLGRIAVGRQPVGLARAHDLQAALPGQEGPVGVLGLDAAAQGLLLLVDPGLGEGSPFQVRFPEDLPEQFETGSEQVRMAGQVGPVDALVMQVEDLERSHPFGLRGEGGAVEIVPCSGSARQSRADPRYRAPGARPTKAIRGRGPGPQEAREKEIDPHRLEAPGAMYVQAQPGTQEKAVEVRVALRGHGESGKEEV